MKLLHLSDLHIGKRVHGFCMLDDQRVVLEQVKDYISIHKPQALILAGDIYDRSNPAAEAIALFSEFVATVLNEYKTPILAVAGNHDGAELIGYGNQIFDKLNFYIEGVFKPDVRKVQLCDEHGTVNFYLLPFADHQVVRDVLKDPDIKNLDEAAQAIMRNISSELDAQARNVLITHGYLTGGTDPELCDSEKPLSIGGKGNVRVAHFEVFDYVALGHLHQAQKIGSDKVRYAGSLLPYSFSEEQHKKTVTLVDIDASGEVQVRLLPLRIPHSMYTLRGSLSELLDNVRPELRQAYLQIILTDENELVEPKRQLDKCYDNIMLFSIQNRLTMIQNIQLDNAKRKHKAPLDMFEDFYRSCTQEDMSEVEREFMAASIEQLKGGGL